MNVKHFFCHQKCLYFLVLIYTHFEHELRKITLSLSLSYYVYEESTTGYCSVRIIIIYYNLIIIYNNYTFLNQIFFYTSCDGPYTLFVYMRCLLIDNYKSTKKK